MQGKTSDELVLLFLHGYLDNSASFCPLLDHLNDFSCLSLDLPGHGKTFHRSHDAHYHLIDYAYDLHRLIQDIGHGQIILVGHSLGGIIASILASTGVESIASLVCIESAGPLSEIETTTSAQITQSFISRDSVLNKAHTPPQSHDLDKLIKLKSKIGDLSEDHSKLILQRNLKSVDGRYYWRSDRALKTQSVVRMTESQAQDVLVNVSCPSHLILGSSGYQKLKRLIKVRHNIFQRWQQYECDGNHYVHMQSPIHVADIIKNVAMSTDLKK